MINMKYSIQETGETISPYKLFRYDEYAGVPNNAELEFWMRIQKLQERINQLELDNESLRQERNNLLVQNGELEYDDYSSSAAIAKYQEKLEELEAQNKILIETGHWIGQDEAHDLKEAVKKFLDITRLRRILDEEATIWEVPCWQMDELSKALRDSKFNSPPKHKEPPHNHPTQTQQQESEHPQKHEG